MLWKFFYAGSQIRAVQIHAMRNHASRGMTVFLLKWVKKLTQKENLLKFQWMRPDTISKSVAPPSCSPFDLTKKKVVITSSESRLKYF